MKGDLPLAWGEVTKKPTTLTYFQRHALPETILLQSRPKGIKPVVSTQSEQRKWDIAPGLYWEKRLETDLS